MEQHRDVLERPCASAALAGLVAFAALTSDSSGLGKHQLALYDPGRWVVGGVAVVLPCVFRFVCVPRRRVCQPWT